MAGSNRLPAQTRGQIPQGWGAAEPAAAQGQAPQQQPYQPQSHVPHSQPLGYPQQTQAPAHQAYADDPMMRWALQPQPASYHHPAQQPVADPFAGQPPVADPFAAVPHQPQLSSYSPPGQQGRAPERQQGNPAQHGHYQAPQAGHGYPQPAFDPYAQPQQPYGQQQPVPTGYAGEPQPGYGSPPLGYPAGPGGQPGYDQGQLPPDAQSWDLSQYSAGQPPAPANSWHNGAQAQPQGYPGYDQQGYPLDPFQQQAAAQQAAHDPRYQQWPQAPGGPLADPAGYDAAHGGGLQPAGYAPGFPGQPGVPPHGFEPSFAPDAQQDQGEIYDEPLEDAPRRGPRPLLVASALIGAIVLGGGLVYGYRMLGGGKEGGKPPVVRADKSPSKVKPSEPTGKAFEHTGSKFPNRLGEAGSTSTAATASPAPSDPDSPRSVRTIRVNPDGTLSPQSTVVTQAPPPAPPAPARVPGMIVDGFGGPAPAPATAPAPTRAPEAQVPKVADLPVPKVREPRATAAVVEPRAVAVEPKAETSKKRPKPRDDAAAPKGDAPAAANAGTVVGFVPVLASKKSREDALRSFADLHQKYPDILTGKAPDVIEASIPEKGTWYRLIIGPPGSREAARDLCTKLDAQGFKGCWATAYRQ